MVSKITQRKRLKRTAKGLGTLIEVSGVDIANQKRLIELLGSDAVKIYKQFNFQFGENVAKDVRKVIPKDTGKLVVLIAKNTIDETYYWIGKRKMTAAKSMGQKMTKVLEKNQKMETEKTGLDIYL